MRGFTIVATFLLCVSAITIEKPKKKADKKAADLKDTKTETVEKKEKTAADGKKYQKVGDRTWAERGALPKFFWRNEIASRDEEGFSWGSYRFGLDTPGLRSHPAKAKNMGEAQFVIMCCLEDKTKDAFLKLAQRTPERPWLVKTLKGSEKVQAVFKNRTDFLAMNYDLRDSMDKSAEPLRGITIAPHNYFNGHRSKIDDTREFFITFQGRKTSKLRHELHDAFNKHRLYKLFKNISVETVMDRMWNVKQQTGDHKFNMKMNSVYVLLPKGDDRWSLRFSETIGAGAIPVILADGLTLPYENTIDWSKAAIRLPNDFGKNADDIMKHLPSDEATIMKMRKEVYEINRKYFVNPDARADTMLVEAAAMVKKGGKYDPIWRPELAEPWLEADRKGSTEESRKTAAPLAKKFKPTQVPAYLRTAEQNATLAEEAKAEKEEGKKFLDKFNPFATKDEDKTNATKVTLKADKPKLIKRK